MKGLLLSADFFSYHEIEHIFVQNKQMFEKTEHRHTGKQKLSSGMAMILGALLTIELMIGGAMILNFDFKGADIIAVVLAFMVLYFAVVASLTDK